MNEPKRKSFSRALNILSKQDKKKIVLVTILQVLLSGLDLLGVLSIGLLGTLTINGIKSSQNSNLTVKYLKLIGIEGKSLHDQAIILGLLAIIFLVFASTKQNN